MELQILTAKDVANILRVSERTAQRYIKDIKQEFGLKTKITKAHLTKYLSPNKVN